ncbi:hypothetical protein FQN52_001079 [Onygenales sp. PD_12]|nr:hypothetical protein FQN53_009770 [Emmonsiellopsis sp. PD_33]KAK2793493.1 hypothetical protein FQN52_001079 [Onygenales sp. PD_12]
MAPIPVTGVKTGNGPNGEIPLRLEIHDLARNVDQWGLYVLALRIFYDKPADDPKSYFQISGVHGMPYLPWNGEEVPRNGPKPTGYCTHSTVLFPSWHRPYVALYEQCIHEIITTEIVPKIPESDRARYEKAAETFRIPYWDWATRPSTSEQEIINKWLPPTCQEKEVPNLIPGFPQVIENPLYQYVLKGDGKRVTWGDYGVGTLPGDNNEQIEYGNCVGLSRCPEQKYYLDEGNPADPQFNAAVYKEKWREGEINSLKVHKNFTDELGWYNPQTPVNILKKEYDAAENIYRLFNYSESYADFATTGVLPKTDADLKTKHWYQSLEALHNNVHLFVGGGNNGHMTQVPVASFDPFFWLHHANVERFYSMWQFIHEDKWFEDRKEILRDAVGNALNGQGEPVKEGEEPVSIVVGPSTPLAPFRNPEGKIYDSNDVRKNTFFNYTYPELQTWKFPDRQAHLGDICKQINEKYGSQRRGALENRSSAETLDVVINVTYYKFLFSGMPFTVKMHLQHGEVKDPKLDYIGCAYNFSAPSTLGGKEVCSNCTVLEMNGAKCSAQLAISHMLKFFPLYKGDENINIQDPDQVEKFIKKRLYVQILSASGREIIPDNKKQTITVEVAHSKVRYTNDDTKLTTFGAFENFLSLAGDIAELLVAGPGALVLGATGIVRGILNNDGDVNLVDGGVKKLTEVSGITNDGARSLLGVAGAVTGGVTDLATNILGGGDRGKDRKGGGGLGFGLF